MAGHDGYGIIRNAISLELAQRASEGFGDFRVHSHYGKLVIYDKPPVAEEIERDFTSNADRTTIEALAGQRNVPSKPSLSYVATFRETPLELEKIKGVERGRVLVMIALTDLDESNGMLRVLKGSQGGGDGGPLTPIELKRGDAVALAGGLGYKNPAPGGGKFMNLIYMLE